MISVVIIEICELEETAFVEKDWVGSLDPQFCGELERETAREESK